MILNKLLVHEIGIFTQQNSKLSTMKVPKNRKKPSSLQWQAIVEIENGGSLILVEADYE